MTQVEPLFYHYTQATQEDKLVEILSCTNTYWIDEQTHEIHIEWKYLKQAEKLLYRINIFRPPPKFEINVEDIPTGLIHVLDSLSEKTKDEIVTNAVRRIYASVNPEYFHTNGIYGKVSWITIPVGKEDRYNVC